MMIRRGYASTARVLSKLMLFHASLLILLGVEVLCFQVNPPPVPLSRRPHIINRILGSTIGDSEVSVPGDDSDVNGSVLPPSVRQQDDLGRAPCKIVVCGVGGGGGNAINHMIDSNLNDGDDLTFWAINTDAQALAKNKSPNKLNIGRELTRGLGAGGDPKRGAKAAVESTHDIKEMCQGADLVFITAGMGGGTGSGAAPVLAEIAKYDCKCLTVAVVTKPFAFEGRRRMRQAQDAIAELKKYVDTYIEVSNDKLLEMVPADLPVSDAFLVADDVLRQGVVGITDIITKAGLVNVDFADVQAVMREAGPALIGIGSASGKQRAPEAARAAISSPLLDSPIRNAKRVVFNIMGGEDMGLSEVNQASEIIYDNCAEDANIIFGSGVDPELLDEMRVTVIACDFDSDDDGSADTQQSPSRERPAGVIPLVEDPKPSDPVEPTPAATDPVPLDAVPRTQTLAEAQQNLPEGDPIPTFVKEAVEEPVPVPLVLKKRGFRAPSAPSKREPKKSMFRRLFGKLVGR